MVLGTHFTRASDVIVPDYLTTSPSVPIFPYRDVFGNWCSRIVAPAALPFRGGAIRTLQTRTRHRDVGLAKRPGQRPRPAAIARRAHARRSRSDRSNRRKAGTSAEHRTARMTDSCYQYSWRSLRWDPTR